MSGHTPGPWRQVSGQGGVNNEKCFGIAGADQPSGQTGPVVCLITTASVASNADVGNARLIVAAPDLLAFAQAYVAAWEAGTGTVYLIDQARAVIALATQTPTERN